MSTIKQNIFSGIPKQFSAELFESLLNHPAVRIERIVSRGHIKKAGEWYDQVSDEWVLVLEGEALLTYQGEPEPIHLKTGDYVLIPAHTRHRVDWTPADINTIWLAIHLPQQ